MERSRKIENRYKNKAGTLVVSDDGKSRMVELSIGEGADRRTHTFPWDRLADFQELFRAPFEDTAGIAK